MLFFLLLVIGSYLQTYFSTNKMNIFLDFCQKIHNHDLSIDSIEFEINFSSL